jgi:uncharacterized hydrophobic protein (TIGR00341 family)
MHLIEVLSNGPINDDLNQYIESIECMHKIFQSGKSGAKSIRIVVPDKDFSTILKELDQYLVDEKVVVLNVVAVLPDITRESEAKELSIGRFFTANKEELRDLIVSPVNLSTNFLVMVILSTIVAGIGILQQNVAIIIGAMVIAPFLSPNMLISFGITLGDAKLVNRGLFVGFVATFIALFISIFWGGASGQLQDVPRDYSVTYQEIALAMACGFAGALSLLSRQGMTLVGVMVAAALLPPLIAGGLFLGAGDFESAANKFLLYTINVLCLILSSIVMFYFSGITPSAWWEKDKARQKTLYAIVVLVILLSFLATIIYQMQS